VPLIWLRGGEKTAPAHERGGMSKKMGTGPLVEVPYCSALSGVWGLRRADWCYNDWEPALFRAVSADAIRSRRS
jgi:hypothetical protein